MIDDKPDFERNNFNTPGPELSGPKVNKLLIT